MRVVLCLPLSTTYTLFCDWVILKVLDEGDHTAWNLRLAPCTYHILEVTHIAGCGEVDISIVECLLQYTLYHILLITCYGLGPTRHTLMVLFILLLVCSLQETQSHSLRALPSSPMAPQAWLHGMLLSTWQNGPLRTQQLSLTGDPGA